MKSAHLTKPLLIAALIAGVAVCGYLSRKTWLPEEPNSTADNSVAPHDKASSQSNQVIIGDQAQKNLGLSSKRLKADVFWKTITVQGMVVDRPGASDREVVAPAIGIISQILHVPGDKVRPGDVLFTLKLSSDSIQQAQTELYKATQNIKLAQAVHQRLADAGGAIPKVRLIEVENDITRLEVTAKAYAFELRNRGFSNDDIDGVAEGKFVREIPIVVPQKSSSQESSLVLDTRSASSPDATPPAFEVQKLNVNLGQQVQAGESLCMLSNHQLLAIEGQAFRDESLLIERSIREGWPVEVDFQENGESDWPAIEQKYFIRQIANTIDPVNRTFAFLIPLENQLKTISNGNKTQWLWRFRPGQRVRLHVRVDKLENVFVLPADAVVREAADAFVFIQNVNTFERKPVQIVLQDRDRAVIANDGSLPTYTKNDECLTIPFVVRNAASQLNRMAQAGSSEAPKGFHVHADGSLHKNEDETK